MNIASIDIGSNSVILLIAGISDDGKSFTPLKNLYATPRISRNLTDGGRFAPDSIDRLIETLKNYISVSKEYNAGIILAGATQAFRKAADASSAASEIKKKLGIEIRILSGYEEGLLTFLGAVTDFNAFSGYLIDIGGASTEIMLGNKGKILFSHSFNFGAVSLCEYFNSAPPAGEETILAIKNHIIREIKGNPPPLHPCGAIAVAGTPTTLACMHAGIKDFDETIIEGYNLKAEGIKKLIAAMSILTPPEILDRYGEIIAGREDLMLTGAVILNTVMEILKLEEVQVSARGLRHGIIYNYLNKII